MQECLSAMLLTVPSADHNLRPEPTVPSAIQWASLLSARGYDPMLPECGPGARCEGPGP